MERHEESVAELKLAQQLDPLSLIINLDIGQMFYFARQYDQALAHFRKTLEMDADFIEAHRRIGVILCQKGQYAEAIAAKLLQQACSVHSGFSDDGINRQLPVDDDTLRSQSYHANWRSGHPFPSARLRSH